MASFCVVPLQRRSEFKPGVPVKIDEGAYRGGLYHLIRIDGKRTCARFFSPEILNTHLLNGHDQGLHQGRISNKLEIGRMQARAKEFQAAGKVMLDDLISGDPKVLLASDASNSPLNEGHFAIQDGKILPLPEGSQPVTGKHYVLSTAEGRVSFPLVDTEDAGSVRLAGEGFFAPKIIHEGSPLRLLDEIPGTSTFSLSCYRGHIGQIFNDEAYSEMNSPKRAEIHTQLLEYLRDPVRYARFVRDIMYGLPVKFGEHGMIKFSPMVYNHTYWIESTAGDIYLFKTYPSRTLEKTAGVTFNDGPDLLIEVAETYGFGIRNAFIGTNGKDVRVILPKDGKPAPIRTIENYPNQTLGDGNYFDRPLANFIAFSEV
jgi:hypothetical protein